MNKATNFTGQPIFSQLLSFIPRGIISKAVSKHKSDNYYKKFKSYDHLVSMLYACFQRCSSIREVTTGLMACESKLAHLSLKYIPARSTLADGNRQRTSMFFEDIYHGLYKHYFDNLPDSRLEKPIEKRLFLVDSTTISLFSEIMKGMGTKRVNGKKKGGAKAHLVVKAEQDVACFAMITHATKNDKEVLHKYNFPAGAIVVFDKGYNSYKQFDKWNKEDVTWVTRMSPVAWEELKESHPVAEIEHQKGIVKDDIVILGRPSNKETIKITVRRIEYFDKESKRTFVFITNQMQYAPSLIAELYKRRWQIELLFKRMKQNYPLKYFLGDSENAIRIQIWCALICDLLLQIIKKKVKRKWSFSNIAGMVRLHLMNYLHLIRFLNDPEKVLKNIRAKKRHQQLQLNWT